jgi:hypothetical protein
LENYQIPPGYKSKSLVKADEKKNVKNSICKIIVDGIDKGTNRKFK